MEPNEHQDKTLDSVPLVTAVSILHLSGVRTEDGEESSLAPPDVRAEAVAQEYEIDAEPAVRFPVPQVIQIPGIDSSFGSSLASLSVPCTHSTNGHDARSTNSPQSYPTDDTVVGSQESCFSSLFQEYSTSSLTRYSVDPPGSDADSVVSAASSRLSVDPPGSTGEALSRAESRSSRPDPPLCESRRTFKFFPRPHSRRNIVLSPQQQQQQQQRQQQRQQQVPFPQGGFGSNSAKKRQMRRPLPPVARKPDPPESLLAASVVGRPGAYRMPRCKQELGQGISSPGQRDEEQQGPRKDDNAFVCLEATLVQEGLQKVPPSPISSKVKVEVSLSKKKKKKGFSKRSLCKVFVLLFFVAAATTMVFLKRRECDEGAPSQLRRGTNNPYALILSPHSNGIDIRECHSEQSDYQVCLNTRLSSQEATLCTQCVQDAIDEALLADKDSCDAKGFCTDLNTLCDCGPCQVDIVEWVDCSVSSEEEDDGDSCRIDCYEQ